MSPANYLFLPGILLFSLCWLGCQGTTEPVSSTEIGNPTLTGIVNSEGSAAAGVVVTLYPHDFHPVIDDVPDSLRAITDSSGAYRFSVSEPGMYNIQVLHPESQAADLIRSVEVPDENEASLTAADAELREPAELSIHVPDGGLKTGSHIYIRGSGISHKITPEDLAMSKITLKVPAVQYSAVNFSHPDIKVEMNLLSEDKTLSPGKESEIGPFASWNYSARIVINTSTSGANIQQDLTGFPLLIRIDGSNPESANIFDQTLSAGNDIRFTASDGITVLPHEIESWSNSNQLAEVWVRSDRLKADNDSQYIYVYTGNIDAPDRSSGPEVFDVSTDWIGVWHLHKDPSASEPQIPDASHNQNHGTVGGTLTTGNRVRALIDLGLKFDEPGQRVTTEQTFFPPNTFTVSVWFNTSAARGDELISFNLIEDGLHWHDRQIWLGDNGRVFFGVYTNLPDSVPPEDSLYITPATEYYTRTNYQGFQRYISSNSSYNDGNWHHVTAGLSSQGMVLYVDGHKVASRPDVISAQAFPGGWSLGNNWSDLWEGGPTDRFFPGIIDEARVIHKKLSESWIKLSYENQKPGSSVVEIRD